MKLIYVLSLAAIMAARAPAAAEPATPETQAAGSAQPAQDPRDRKIEELERVIGDLKKRVEELEKQRAPEASPAPAPAPARGGGGATLLPNISAIGNLQFRGGDSRAIDGRGQFHFEELEVAVQDAVAPKLRYDVFLNAAHDEEWKLGMEEGYLTASALKKGLTARIGRIRTPFGKFNPLHPHSWWFITQPSVSTAFLGPEGLVSDGAVVQYLLPVKATFANLELGRWETTSETEKGLGFGGGDGGAWSGRLWLGKEVGKDRELELGFSHYMGRGGLAGFDRKLKEVSGVDLTYRSYPGAYRRLWLTTELMRHATHGINGDTKDRLGAFALAAYRWSRYWEAGLRGDYTRYPFPLDGHEWGASLFLSRYITEQTSLRAEYRYANTPDFGGTNGIFLQLLFGSGPHQHRLQ